ncbi:hypothetical protein FGO68_gene3325 [Halteria grandinella]|uniref:MAPEG family protein n=1 Tax=Halteria grandinella TaxID=5974 RepID=A0A8J8SZ77_HALGN|nr:hypothetical protein FGO68_gene3325 [Halteria grandinella]
MSTVQNAPLNLGVLTQLFKTAEQADLYRYVALTAAILLFHYTLTGFIAAGSMRSKIFTEEFMTTNFKEEHEKAFPEGRQRDLPKGGYPDMGSGRYIEKATYKQWYEFNVGQRIHYHYLESITCVISWILIGGLEYPEAAIALGGGYGLGRVLFHIGYATKGPRGRAIGFVLQGLSSIALVILAFVSSIQIGKRLSPN